MLALMSPKADAKSAKGFRAFMRAEFPLVISLGTAAIFFKTGSRLVEIITHPVALIAIFLWLFVVVLWSAMSVVRHADSLAIRFGEPYGTLILTLAAISIEVMMISRRCCMGRITRLWRETRCLLSL